MIYIKYLSVASNRNMELYWTENSRKFYLLCGSVRSTEIDCVIINVAPSPLSALTEG